MRWFLILLLSVMGLSAQTYTEFYCDASVSANNTNVNAGSTTGGPVYGPSVNGNWDGTSVFTPTDGSTPASTVSAGMWMSVYYDNSTNLIQAGTMGGGIGLVTNVAAGVNGAITIDRRTVSGTVPTSNATGRSARVGGSWVGPYGTIGFPFGFIGATSTNGPYVTRVNFKNAANYAITAAMSHSIAGPVIFQGYASSVGDGGLAAFLDNTTAASYVLLTISGANNELLDAVLSSTFSSGTSAGLVLSGPYSSLRRVVVHDVRANGINMSGGQTMIDECEVYNCNKNGSAGQSAIRFSGNGSIALRCIAHDNSTAGTVGFGFDGAGAAISCIADTNARDGFNGNTAGAEITMIGCDAYNNGDDGLDITTTGAQSIRIENCNFVKNTGWGINSSGTLLLRDGWIVNCGFGSGTQVNGSGAINAIQGVRQIGNITYAANATPWADPANGDFRIILPAAKSAGRGTFTQTAASYAGTVAYPDIGAAQSPSTNTPGSWTFSQ